jgi:hypothetical protein
MGKLIMHVDGMDGQIDLLPDRVIIYRKGLWNSMKYGMHAKREIPLGAISEIGFKDASVISFGEIEFVRSGRSTEERMKSNSNAVKFPKKKQREFERLKEKIFEILEYLARQKQ